MASELRRAARALLERRTQRTESLHGLEESKARLAAALDRAGLGGATVFTPRWRSEDGRAILEATYEPPPRTARWLELFSVGLAGLVAASVWAALTQEGPWRLLLPMLTALAILAMPYVALGLGSQRAAEEARIAKAIRVALLDEEERYPRARRWEDED